MKTSIQTTLKLLTTLKHSKHDDSFFPYLRGFFDIFSEKRITITLSLFFFFFYSLELKELELELALVLTITSYK
jgi:hypothetical protein